MISILIPVYNNDVTELVKDIDEQSKILNIPYEIIIVDDNSNTSTKEANRPIADYDSVKYEELSRNIGRSRIRNLMAEKATYDTLIFLDSDSQISGNTNFLKNYIKLIESFSIVNGGRIYAQKIKKKETILHHTYGRIKECPSVEKRNKFPIRYFHSNNFMVKKSLLLAYPFPNMKTGYGYEDLVFATSVSKAGNQIKHLDNPVEHNDLISSKQFLLNVQSANTNLLDFYHADLIQETPLLNTYNRLKTLGLLGFVGFMLSKNISHIRANLMSTNPSLFYLDLFKLNDFISQAKVRR